MAGETIERSTTAPPSDDPNVVVYWDQAHRYTPGPRHRRRMIRGIVRGLRPVEVLDAGCGQPLLLDELVSRCGVRGFGCDISDQVMDESQESHPAEEFKVVNLETGRWPGDRQFDLVISTETIEHIDDWRAAVHNLAAMARDHLLITVPGGKRRSIDRQLGHFRHYSASDIVGALDKEGFDAVLVRNWGFPFYDLYRAAIEKVGGERVYDSIATSKPYGLGKRLLTHALYALFFLNDPFKRGDQLIVLGRRRREVASA